MNNLINKITAGNCVELMKQLPDASVDMCITSPPYDNLRTYKGYSFPFEEIAAELFRVIKEGGVVVWVVNDATINGTETGTSFRQALKFKEIGFNIHDTMIFLKSNPIPQIYRKRYTNVFEYMFVFSKGAPKTFNPIMVPCKCAGQLYDSTAKNMDGESGRHKLTYNVNNEKKISYIPVKNDVQVFIEQLVRCVLQQRCRGKPPWYPLSEYGSCIDIWQKRKSKIPTTSPRSQKPLLRSYRFRETVVKLHCGDIRISSCIHAI